MTRLGRIFIAMALIGAWWCQPGEAADYAGALTEVGWGPQSQGMGNAFTAVGVGAAAPYWNPAGLIGGSENSVATAYQPLSLDRNLSSISLALNRRRELGIGLTWLHASVGDIISRSGDGLPSGTIEDSENAYYLSVARALGGPLVIGFTLKIINQRIKVPQRQAATADGHGFDFGLRYALGQRTHIAAVVRNLDAKFNWKVRRGNQQTTNTSDTWPTTLVLGVAHRPFDALLLAADLYSGTESHANLGLEWTATPVLTLRGGLERLGSDTASSGSVTAGLTLRPMRSQVLQFHYGYADDPLDGSRNSVGLSARF